MRRFAAPILALSVWSCGDSLQPGDVVGSYTLVGVAGGTPPQVVVNNSDCRITVAEGTLVLRPDRSFDMELIEVNECPLSGGPSDVIVGSFGNYQVEGDRVTLTAIGDVSVPFPARFADQRLVITYGFRYGELVFELRNS
jgi:hypothetical protein